MECQHECQHEWIFVNGMKICNKCYQECSDMLEIDDNAFTDTHIFMNMVNGGGLIMSGGYNKYNMSSYGKSLQHLCNLNNHNYTNRLLYISTLKIEEIVNNEMLPIELIQATINYFKTILEIKQANNNKRYNIMQLLASCFYYASKNLKYNFNHKMIAKMFNLTEKHVAKGIKIFNIYMQNQSVISMSKETDINNIYEILNNFIEMLNIDDEYFIAYCNKIVQIVYDNNILYKYSHIRTAITIIYYVNKMLNFDIQLKDLEKISNLSTQSIIKSFNIIVSYNKYLID